MAVGTAMGCCRTTAQAWETDRQMNENVLKSDEMNVGPSSLMWCSIASSMSA